MDIENENECRTDDNINHTIRERPTHRLTSNRKMFLHTVNSFRMPVDSVKPDTTRKCDFKMFAIREDNMSTHLLQHWVAPAPHGM